ncbi:uncharacterized protein LOC110599638 isoform X3 [Manihot esculenta]|uniref:uncharacterized protein LOC110599638 isoform X3 n=1 Tax=Manihot esculenta TaxID=3983 RepID=UPI001CC3D162|nr:uncharacterized protein LOC110599638 isoform X3 [Manihot esculenta]
MVQLMESGNLPAETEIMSSSGKKVTVKLEIAEDPLEEDHEPLNKRYKPSQAVQQQWGAGANAFPIPPAHNPLDEPSPLGLRLRKSPSLLDLIQMRLAQAGASVLGSEQTESNNSGVKKETNTTAASGITDKLKASNFPASILRIGNWEYKSRYEGELVAKCYFAKHKLVWEVLEGGLKSKIEIQWSDIMALKANCPDKAPGTLTVVCSLLDSLFSTGRLIHSPESTPYGKQQQILLMDRLAYTVMDTRAIEGSGICEAVDSKGPRNWDQIKVPGLHPSMSMSDLMNHIGNCISEQMTSGYPPFSADGSECQDILEDIAEYLLSDTQLTTSSDEKRLMARVNSLCCLLQTDPASTQNLQVNDERCFGESENGKGVQLNPTNELLQENKSKIDTKDPEVIVKDVSGSKQAPGMSRKDSFGELLLHLPRIASLPKFLFNISKEDDG